MDGPEDDQRSRTASQNLHRPIFVSLPPLLKTQKERNTHPVLTHSYPPVYSYDRSQLFLVRSKRLSILTLDLPGRPALFREPMSDDNALAVLRGLVRSFALVFEMDCYF